MRKEQRAKALICSYTICSSHKAKATLLYETTNCNTINKRKKKQIQNPHKNAVNMHDKSKKINERSVTMSAGFRYFLWSAFRFHNFPIHIWVFIKLRVTYGNGVWHFLGSWCGCWTGPREGIFGIKCRKMIKFVQTYLGLYKLGFWKQYYW